LKKILLLLPALLLSACSERKTGPQLFEAGFKIIRVVDKTRIYKPDTDTSNYLHFRPLDIDIWYPAKITENDSPLVFRDILTLLEKRANYYTASEKWTGITSQVAESFCEGFKCSDTSRLLNFKTHSYRDAASVDIKFPLVIYMCAFNGMSYENYSLFESLAKKGFVVISVSSIGRYPGDMTMKNEDMLEQVDDGLASLRALGQNTNIDFSKIGVVGYSWGGLSAAILAGSVPDVACLISFDGSEYHHYGKAKDEDQDFDSIRISPEFIKLKLPVSYLRLESSPGNSSNNYDSIFDFSKKLTGDKMILKIDSAQHEDFSCLSVVVRKSGNCKVNDCYNTITELAIPYLEDHLKNEHLFAISLKAVVNKRAHIVSHLNK
jgi:Dienelactone hydrolase family